MLGRKLSTKQLENHYFVHFCPWEREGRADRRMKQDNLGLQQSDNVTSTIQLPLLKGIEISSQDITKPSYLLIKLTSEQYPECIIN